MSTTSSLADASAKLLDVKATAAMLGVSVRHVFRLADSGRMPRPLKLGKLVRWSVAELDAWVAAGCPSCRSAKGGRS